MDNSNPTGPPASYLQQPTPVQQKAGMQPPPPPQMVQYPVPPVQIQRADLVPFSKGWHVTKIVLGSMSIVFSIVVLALGIYSVSTSSVFWAGFQFGFSGTVGAMALIWQTAEFITICSSSRHRGIHPGANVAIHLLIWIMAIASLSVTSIYVAEWAYTDDESYYSTYYRDELEWARETLSVEIAILSFVAALLIIHFTLFVRACIETHEYNRAMRTVYLPIPVAQYGYYQAGPPQPQPYPYGMQQMPQQPRQQVPQQQMAQQNQLYGYYAPPAPAVPGPSHQPRGHDTQRDSTVSSATPPTA